MASEVWTVSYDSVTVHEEGGRVRVLDGLAPGQDVEVRGVGTVRTLDRPPGEHLATVYTVNDVHFGELECGRIDGLADVGPVLTSEPGEDPYPETMNRAAVAEISAAAGQAGVPTVVAVKGDLTAKGHRHEYEAFLGTYGAAFGDRLLHVRGNHDAMQGLDLATGPRSVDAPGVTVALLDTVIPGKASGSVDGDQLDWLDELAEHRGRDGAVVLAMGHHHPWGPGSSSRPDGYFGIHPDASERLVEVIARRRAVAGWFAGHTHRNRVRRFAATGPVPYVEVACTKDFPGSWAEYRVFEGGVVQLHHRISTQEALAWSDRCRQLLGGLYPDYASGTLADRCFTIAPR